MSSAYLRDFSIAAEELTLQMHPCTWFFHQNSLYSKYNLTKFLRETVKGQSQISAILALGNSRACFFWVGLWQVLVTAAGVLLFCNSPGHVPGRSKDLLWLRVLGTSTNFLAEHRYQLDCVHFSDYRADVPFDKSQRIWPPGNQFIKSTKSSPSPD